MNTKRKSNLYKFLAISSLSVSLVVLPITIASCQVSFSNLKLKKEIVMKKDRSASSFVNVLKEHLGELVDGNNPLNPNSWKPSENQWGITSIDFAKSIESVFNLSEYIKRPSQLFENWNSSDSLPDGLQIYMVGREYKDNGHEIFEFVAKGDKAKKFYANRFWDFRSNSKQKVTSDEKAPSAKNTEQNDKGEDTDVITLYLLMILRSNRKVSPIDLIFSKSSSLGIK